jgi:hypothetical protein
MLIALINIQVVLWDLWPEKIKLKELASIGLKHMFFDHLIDSPVANLSHQIKNILRPLISKYNGCMDKWLSLWLEKVISSKVILSDRDHFLFVNGKFGNKLK